MDYALKLFVIVVGVTLLFAGAWLAMPAMDHIGSFVSNPESMQERTEEFAVLIDAEGLATSVNATDAETAQAVRPGKTVAVSLFLAASFLWMLVPLAFIKTGCSIVLEATRYRTDIAEQE